MAYFLTVMCLCITTSLFAKNYGTHGQTFPIIEENLIDFLTRQTKSLSPDEVISINQKIQKQYKKRLVEPLPVKHLKNATIYAVHYFDPTITTTKEIKDSLGKTIVEKGFKYNPLNHFSLTEDLLFFAGDNPVHLEWAISLGESKKWILVSGQPLQLEEKENRPVFFDQNGLLTQKLKITEIPALVSQKDNLLKIETIPLAREKCD